MSGVCVYVCVCARAYAPGRKNESLEIRKQIGLSGWNSVC